MKSTFSLACLFTVAIVLGGCSTTKLNDTWQAESFSRSSFNNVLIIGLTSDKSNRLLFEDTFSEVFNRENIINTVSRTGLTASYPKKEDVLKFLATHSFDYVLVTRAAGMDVETESIRPRAVTYYTGPYYPSYHGNWSGSSVTMTQDGYTDTKVDYRLVTSIYNAKTEELVWEGRSSTWDAQSTSKLAEDLANMVVEAINR